MNRVEPKTLSGFMELMPSDQILFDKIKNTIEEVYASYGFYSLDTPIIESSEVLLAKQEEKLRNKYIDLIKEIMIYHLDLI